MLIKATIYYIVTVKLVPAKLIISQKPIAFKNQIAFPFYIN